MRSAMNAVESRYIKFGIFFRQFCFLMSSLAKALSSSLVLGQHPFGYCQVEAFRADPDLCIVKTAPPTKSRTYAPLEFRAEDGETSAAMLNVVVFLVSLGVRAIRAMCRRRADLVLENVALRQQVTALKKERPRPPLDDTERAFWVALRGSWPVWASRLLIVHADTVARWHRDRFRRYWAKISQRRHPGRPRIDAEIRRLVRTMAQDGWGAPRIHAELTKLGFIISEITVSRYLPRRPAEPDQLKRWMAFLRNHKDDIAAMDLFTVPPLRYPRVQDNCGPRSRVVHQGSDVPGTRNEPRLDHQGIWIP